MKLAAPTILLGIVLWTEMIGAPLLRAAEPAAASSVPAAEPAATTTPAQNETKAAVPKDAPVAAFSAPRETAIAKVLKHRGVTGEIARVPAGDETFLALVTSPRKSAAPQGAVLLLPTLQGAVSDPLILALAAAPPVSGWLTMVMQPPAGASGMPTDAKNVLCARIMASLKFLQGRGAQPVVLAGIGRSFEIGRACLADKKPAEIIGLVGLGRWQGNLNTEETPLLDIPPTADPRALQAAQQRAIVTETRAQSPYRQLPIDALDERFVGAEQAVAKRLRGWLIQLPRNPKA